MVLQILNRALHLVSNYQALGHKAVVYNDQILCKYFYSWNSIMSLRL